MSVVSNLSYKKGDTLIEVLFATAVFSLLAVGGLSIMNQGLSAAQRSLEITLVRNEIDAQAEMIRLLNYSYVSMYQPEAVYGFNTLAERWSQSIPIFASNTPATVFSVCPSSATDLLSKRVNSFVLNTKNGTFVKLDSLNYKPASTYAKVDYNNEGVVISDGIWIEAVSSNGSFGTRHIDFHIRACWDSPGQSLPATLGTIVRLYEPI